MSYTDYQKRWDSASFASHVKASDLSWADSITIHHTSYPDLAMRPQGLTAKHMRYLMEYYRDAKGWSSGPHLFIDDHAIMGMSPLDSRGVHAKSFNRRSIGIEMLGNFDNEDPHTGRGADVVLRSAKATAIMLTAMGLEPTPITVLFHRDDPKTNKTCPGRKITKGGFMSLVESFMPSPHTNTPKKPEEVSEASIQTLKAELATIKAAASRIEQSL